MRLKKNPHQRTSPARDGALRVLIAVDKEGAYANLALQKITADLKLGADDLALLTELVYGTLRMRGMIDWVIDRFSSTPVSKMSHTVRNIVRLGVYQLLFLNRIPPWAACNEAVEQAKRWRLAGLAGFVNGLLRSIARTREEISYPDPDADPLSYISVKYSHPTWLVERWLNRYGKEETIALCRANNKPAPLVIRCNTLKITPPELQRQLERENVIARFSTLVPEGLVTNLSSLAELRLFQEGYFAVQDESSMIASLVLNPVPGSFVIDACSGPGGKTTHMAQIMQNKGRILALDVHSHRLELVAKACERMGVSIVEPKLMDVRELPFQLQEKADYILVDVPCSGLGVIRRRPDLRWRVKPEDLPQHARQQLEILKSASRCLAAGGILVYSTCTTEPEENTGVIRQFLEECKDFQPEDLSLRLPFPLAWEEDKVTARSGFLQLFPHRHGTDGFFVACLRKTIKGG